MNFSPQNLRNSLLIAKCEPLFRSLSQFPRLESLKKSYTIYILLLQLNCFFSTCTLGVSFLAGTFCKMFETCRRTVYVRLNTCANARTNTHALVFRLYIKYSPSKNHTTTFTSLNTAKTKFTITVQTFFWLRYNLLSK